MHTKTILPTLLLLSLSLSAQAQAWKWAQSLGAPNSNTTLVSIRPYTGNTALVIGNFAATTLVLGSKTLQNAGQDDAYVAIVDASGQYTWAASFGGANRDYVSDVAASTNGGFAVAGNFNSISMTIGNSTLFNSGETDGFVVKYNPDKSLAWVKKIGTAEIDELSGLVVDAEGNTYVSGQMRDKFTQTTVNTFIRKLDPSGNQLWEQKGFPQGSGILLTTALALGEDQSVYLGGTLNGKATFGTLQFANDTTITAFILRYNPSGLILDHYQNSTLEKFNDLQVRDNQVYACGQKQNWGIGWGWPLADSKTYVFKFDADLNLLWSQTAGGESPAQSLDIAQSLSVDELGNVYVTGYFFSDTLHFAGQALPNLFHINYYYPQIFVFKYSSAGNELWAKSMGGILAEEGTSILAWGDDQFYLGGNFESNPVVIGALTLNNTSTLDSMYVHLKPSRYVRKTMGFLGVFDKFASGTNPEPALLEAAISPNPASDQIILQLKSAFNSPLLFQLYASDGQLLRQSIHKEPTTEIRESAAGLTPGIYWVVLHSEEGVFTGKLLLK